VSSPKRTIVLGGQARLPKELSTGEVFQIVVELDLATGEVIDASFGPCLPVVEKMLKHYMMGINLETETPDVLKVIEQRLSHKSRKAILTAIKDLLREYREYQYRITHRDEQRRDPIA